MSEANEANKPNEQNPKVVEDSRSTSQKRVLTSPQTIMPDNKAAKTISQDQTVTPATPTAWGDRMVSIQADQDDNLDTLDNDYTDHESVGSSQEFRGNGAGRGTSRGNLQGGRGRAPGRGRGYGRGSGHGKGSGHGRGSSGSRPGKKSQRKKSNHWPNPNSTRITRSISKLATNENGAMDDAEEEETETPAFKKAELDKTFQAHHTAEDPPNVPGNIGKYQELGIPVTNSGYMNALIKPNNWQMDRSGREKTLDFFWDEYREDYVGEECTSKEVRMLNTGEIEGVEDKRTRDQVNDPLQRAAIASKIFLKDMAKTTDNFHTITFKKLDKAWKEKFPEPTEEEPKTPEEEERMKQRLENRAMMEAIRQENKLMIENHGTYIENVMVAPAVSTAEYQSNKIMELQNGYNLLLKKFGTLAERVEELENTTVTKEDLNRHARSERDARIGIIIKKAPFATKVLSPDTLHKKKVLMSKEIEKHMRGVKCEAKDILAIRAVDHKGKYGDMIKLFMVNEAKKKEIMKAYYSNIWVKNQKGVVDIQYKNAAGRWEDYKSESELDNDRKMESLKGQYYPLMLEEFRKIWKDREEMNEDLKINKNAIIEKVGSFITLHWNSNRPRDTGAHYRVKKRPRNLDDSKAVSNYQEMYIKTLVAAETYEGIVRRREARDQEEAEANAKKFADTQLTKTAPVQLEAGTSTEN